jgi:cytosine/adenosine deaminase-related metal-dependent hydrolase
MKQVWSAEWIYSPDGWLTDHEVGVDESGLVTHVQQRQPETRMLPGCLLPGLVNAHTHSELSHLRNLIPKGEGMVSFVKHIIALRDSIPKSEREAARRTSLEHAWQTGTQLIGDICNELNQDHLPASLTKPARHIFHEYLGPGADSSCFNQYIYNPALDLSPCPHAPYSVSDELAQTIGRFCADAGLPLSIHLLESEPEIDFCTTRSGEFVELFRNLSINLRSVAKSPLEFVINNIPPNVSLLAIHLIEAKEPELLRLIYQFKRLQVCVCPRSSLNIHGKLPNLRLWRKLGLRICIGTDSLASSPDLNIISEMQLIKQAIPEVSLHELIRMATTNGAEALGKAHSYGHFYPGLRPGILHAPDWKPDLPVWNNGVVRLV